MPPLLKFLRFCLVSGAVIYLLIVVLVYFRQRSLLYFPSHRSSPGTLTAWKTGEEIIGYAREVPHPKTVWLMTHGNAGQAVQRDYVLPRMSSTDALYVLEYPGYGLRSGSPSLEAINAAASGAYQLLRTRYPNTRIGVIGESIGSGPACALAAETVPPDKIILVVPFDTLLNVAADHMPLLPVRLMLKDRWDNVAALHGYRGPIEIYGAEDDTVIPIKHARALASATQARFTAIPGGHNDWSSRAAVKIE